MPYRRILVPLDDSGSSQRGLQEALALAKPLGATLVLLHVVEPPMMLMPDISAATTWSELLQAQVEMGRRILEAAEQRARDAGVDCEVLLHDSDPRRVADVIVDDVGKYRCDLVVMGTHGRRGVRRLLLGSDAELVLRQSPVPTMLVREPDKTAKPG